jgi:hypothetical protein
VIKSRRMRWIRPMMGSCEYSKKPSDSIKDGEFD